MDVRYINPFVEALVETFATMTGLSPIALKPYLKANKQAMADVTGMIGFANETVHGSVGLSLDTELALLVYERFMGEAVESINADVVDCIGELVNMVAGGGKSRLSETGETFKISLPKVQIGRDVLIDHNVSAPAVVIPFDAGGLTLKIEIAMENRN